MQKYSNIMQHIRFICIICVYRQNYYNLILSNYNIRDCGEKRGLHSLKLNSLSPTNQGKAWVNYNLYRYQELLTKKSNSK